MTGPYAANGQAAVDGLKAAVNVLNGRGGILGRRVVLEVLDNGGNPTTAAGQLSQRLATGAKPDVIEPGSISTEGVAEVPIAAGAHVLSIGTPADASLNQPSKYPYEFSVAPPANLPAQSLMDYVKSKGWTHLAMLASSDAYGQTVAQATSQAAKQAGINLSAATYNDTDLDVTPQLEQLKSSTPQALFMQSFGSPAGVILSSRQKLQWKIPVIGDLTTSATPLIAAEGGTPAESNMVIQVLPIEEYSANPSPGQLAYVAAMKALRPITTVTTTTSYQYDSLMLVAQAAEQAKSIATPALATALAHLQQPASPPWVTLSAYPFTDANHQPAASPSNWIFVAPTKLVDGQYGAPGA